MKGMVFDIQRCSLHDGPGIRTTVFLKGCPLHCIWCHNPESISVKKQLMYDGSKCINCLACVNSCPTGAHSARKGVHCLDHRSCICCGECIKSCPTGALKIIGEEMDSEAVIAEVLRDMEYYRQSGGGVTISGGEPTYQFDFTRELLKKAREHAVDTCIETCGFAPALKYNEIVPLVDLFLFDYKETNPARHKELTGVSNELILANLDLLYQAGAEIILRCPMVPGINDSHEHLAGIAALSKKYPKLLGIELMPYHNMGIGKTLKLGGTAPLAEVGSADDKVAGEWIDKLKILGCDRAKIS